MTADIVLTDFVQDFDDDKKDIVIALRDITLGIAPHADENVKWGALCFFKGDRPFCGIMIYRKYISVIFDLGAELDDPDNLLEGGGKKMRHLKILKLEDIENKKVGFYIRGSFDL